MRARTRITRFAERDYQDWLAAMQAADEAAGNGSPFYAADRYSSEHVRINWVAYNLRMTVNSYWCVYVLDGVVHTQFGIICRRDRAHNPMTEREYRNLCPNRGRRTDCPVRVTNG